METKKDYTAPLVHVIDLKAEGLLDGDENPSLPKGSKDDNPPTAESKPGDIGFDDEEDHNIWDDDATDATY